MSRKFSQKSQKTKIIKAKLKKMITLVVDFHSSTTYLQSQKFFGTSDHLEVFFSKCPKNIVGPLYVYAFLVFFLIVYLHVSPDFLWG